MFKKVFSKKKKGVIVAIVAGILALTTTITGFVIHFSNKKKNNNNTNNNDTSSISTMEIDDMGAELEIPEEPKTNYENPTGKADPDKVEEKNNKLYVDKESADKSDKVGTSSIDTKNDTLKVDSNGTVKEKQEGYEIKDGKTGSTISTGNLDDTGIPEGFEKNEELDGIYEEKDETENLTIADANYYDEYGNLVLAKGDLVEKERLEYAKKHYSTKKPSQSSTSSTNSSKTSSTTSSSNTSSVTSSSTTSSSNTSTADKGVVNADGTYTIDGITYLSKADYQQCIIDGYEGYAIIDGIMQSIEQYTNQIQKVK